MPDADELDMLPDISGSDLAHLFDYCRALLGEDAEAARTARSALDSAHASQQDPDRRRAVLLSLGREQALALPTSDGNDPCYVPLALIASPGQQTDNGVLRALGALIDRDREILDLVYRHGIRPANLGEVLGLPAAEAYRRLAIAEREYVSLVAEPPCEDADPGVHADVKLEDIAALPLAALPAWTAQPAARRPHGERRSRRRTAQLVAAAVISAATIGAVVSVAPASHPSASRAATSPGNGASQAGRRAGSATSAHSGRPGQAQHRSDPGQPVNLWGPVPAPTWTSNTSSTVIAPATVTVTSVPCPAGTKANFRWHYTADGAAGGWSGTATEACPGSVTMGPQAMDGNLQVTPGTTVQAGYDFTLPGNTNSLTMTVSVAQVTFAVSCVSGAAPSSSALTVALRAQTYQITGNQWYPSGDQSSPLVYQGSVAIPALCGQSGKIRLAKGGTFIASLG